MKLTPREPTPEMAREGQYPLLRKNGGSAKEVVCAIWRAMHDAAPSGWQPIETAPKDGYFLAANKHGVWVAHWQPQAVSGFRFDQPWRSVMLNHWHIEPKSAQYENPTHWMPLPAPPSEQAAPSVEQKLLALLVELRNSLAPTYRLSQEGRAYMKKMDAAIARAKGK